MVTCGFFFVKQKKSAKFGIFDSDDYTPRENKPNEKHIWCVFTYGKCFVEIRLSLYGIVFSFMLHRLTSNILIISELTYKWLTKWLLKLMELLLYFRKLTRLRGI